VVSTDELARVALRRLKNNQTYEDWRAVGRKLVAITIEVTHELQLTEWDQNNRTLTRNAANRFEEWEIGVSNEKPMSKQERWALRELMTNPDIDAYYATLTGLERRRLNHPNAIINHWKKHRGKNPSAPRKNSIDFEVAINTVHAKLEGMDTNNRRAALERITAPFKNDLKEENDSPLLYEKLKRVTAKPPRTDEEVKAGVDEIKEIIRALRQLQSEWTSRPGGGAPKRRTGGKLRRKE
jgi:hypothetical protein